MNSSEKLEWSALEYEQKERNKDWFMALGVIVVTGAAASIIFGNYFFAALLIIGGGLLGYFANRPPQTIDCELNSRGLLIRSDLFLYDSMKAFYVQTSPRPILFIHTQRIFMPILSLSIPANITEDIIDTLRERNVPEEEMQEHASEKILDYFGF